jgi:hypothetical protein
MRSFSLIALLLALALLAAPALAAEQKGAVMGEGKGGAAAAAPGLSEEQLGPCRWVIEGKAEDVKADQNKLVVSTDMGKQPLDIAPQSRVLDKNANEISLSDIKPGQRVVASFHREDGKNIVGRLYQLPEKAPGMGGMKEPGKY